MAWFEDQHFSKEDAPYLEHGMASKAKEAEGWVRCYEYIKEGHKQTYEFFEDVVERYDGEWRAFMFGWCEVFGGI
jgi:hypothetical protein